MSYAAGVAVGRVIIDDTNNVIMFTENAVQFTITLDAGVYYAFGGVGPELAGDYRGIYHAIELTMQGSAAYGDCVGGGGFTINVYTFAASDPALVGDVVDGGITITGDGGLDFQFDFSDPAFTMEKSLFGFLDSESSDKVHSSGVIISDYCSKYRWHAYGLGGPRPPDRASSFAMGLQSFSSAQMSNSVGVDWGEQRFRNMAFSQIFGSHLFKLRALDVAFATVAGLSVGDNHNSLYWIWKNARSAQDFFWLHNATSLDLNISGQSWERVKCADIGQIESMEKLAPGTQPNGDLHSVNLTLWVDESINHYEH